VAEPAAPPRAAALRISGGAIARLGRAQQPSAFDVHAVRRDFPILQERVNGRRWSGSTTPPPPQAAVGDRPHGYFYEHENSNIHRAAHELAARATDAYEARASGARFINAPM
jgi:cysteine desulfurase/selenocysteine lyase